MMPKQLTLTKISTHHSFVQTNNILDGPRLQVFICNKFEGARKFIVKVQVNSVYTGNMFSI